MWYRKRLSGMCVYIYIYIFFFCRVKSWSNVCLLYIKSWSIFFGFVFVCFRKSRSPCRKKRISQKQSPKTTNTQFYKLKIGLIMLRNILGPVFNLYLDQFLTFKTCIFCIFRSFYSAFSKNAKFKETQK